MKLYETAMKPHDAKPPSLTSFGECNFEENQEVCKAWRDKRRGILNKFVFLKKRKRIKKSFIIEETCYWEKFLM